MVKAVTEGRLIQGAVRRLGQEEKQLYRHPWVQRVVSSLITFVTLVAPILETINTAFAHERMVRRHRVSGERRSYGKSQIVRRSYLGSKTVGMQRSVRGRREVQYRRIVQSRRGGRTRRYVTV